MSGTEKPLTAAAMCRVYAAVGAPVVWTPEQLRRFARLLDESEAACEVAQKSAKKLRAAAQRWFWTAVVVNLCTVGVCLYVG